MELQIIYGNRKTSSLRVISETQVLVHIPFGVPKAEVEAMVQKKQVWIQKQVQRIRQQNQMTQAYDLFLFGVGLRLEWIADTTERVIVAADVMHVHCAVKERVKLLASRYMQRRLRETIEEMMVHAMAHFPKLEKQPVLRVKHMRSRWGYCLWKQHLICLNAALIHTPKPCLYYVILHEMMHFYYHDHQAGFHAGMATVMPSYKEVRKTLKDYQFLLEGKQ